MVPVFPSAFSLINALRNPSQGKEVLVPILLTGAKKRTFHILTTQLSGGIEPPSDGWPSLEVRADEGGAAQAALAEAAAAGVGGGTDLSLCLCVSMCVSVCLCVPVCACVCLCVPFLFVSHAAVYLCICVSRSLDGLTS